MKTPRFKAVKTNKGWRLNIPGALSTTGKRAREFFSTREKADGRAAELRANFLANGRSGRILPPAQSDTAERAFTLLADHGGPEALMEAVKQFVKEKDVRSKSVTFKDAFEQFEASNNRSDSYKQSLRQYRERLVGLHGRLLCDLTLTDIESEMAAFTPSVYNYGLRILGGVFNYGAQRDWCSKNIIASIGKKNTPPKDIDVYTPDQASNLMEVVDHGALPWLAVCMFAGLRGSEARQLRWVDIDFEDKSVRVPSVIAKNHQPRLIPMEPNLEQWLLPYRGQGLIAPQGANVLRKQLRAAHIAASVPRIKHGPRHSYASYLLKRDGSIDALRLTMGHTDGSDMTFKHYATQLVTKQQAIAFWSIRPSETDGKIFAIA